MSDYRKTGCYNLVANWFGIDTAASNVVCKNDKYNFLFGMQGVFVRMTILSIALC